MARHGIPTARYRACDTIDEARAVLARGELGLPLVVKADGLAAGKGVVVADDRADGGAGDHARRWTIASSATPARGSCSRNA